MTDNHFDDGGAMTEKAKIFFVRRNICGAWVVYGSEGVKHFYGYSKSQAKKMYQESGRTFVNRRQINDR